ncbi:CDP-archaeol synthase [Candidatus Woesearchaeota archaeon]|nr:CDP-archaeol synthase [Candidatus Woesearchaeota archaeon]
MLLTIISALYYAMPGMLANMSPLFFKGWLKPLAKPVDLGLKIKGKRLLGDHKTFRGFVLGMITGMLAGFLQYIIRDFAIIQSISYIDYTFVKSIGIGLAFGFAALLGDSAKSLVKRQVGIRPGKPFIPFDQVDYIVGIIAFSYLFRPMTWQMIAALVLIGPLLHLAFTKLGYFLKIRKERW